MIVLDFSFLINSPTLTSLFSAFCLDNVSLEMESLAGIMLPYLSNNLIIVFSQHELQQKSANT